MSCTSSQTTGPALRNRILSSAVVALVGLGLASCGTLRGARSDLASLGRALKAPPSMPAQTGSLHVMEIGKYAAHVRVSGYGFESDDNTVNVYLDQPLQRGKHYWEVRQLCSHVMAGVTNDVGTARHWGGYSEENAGVYSYVSQLWPAPDPKPPRWNLFSDTGDVFGFALDAGAGTLRVFVNNAERGTITLPFKGPYYPYSGHQSGFRLDGQPCPDLNPPREGWFGPTRAEFLVGQGRTLYPPPKGYSHLTQ